MSTTAVFVAFSPVFQCKLLFCSALGGGDPWSYLGLDGQESGQRGKVQDPVLGRGRQAAFARLQRDLGPTIDSLAQQ